MKRISPLSGRFALACALAGGAWGCCPTTEAPPKPVVVAYEGPLWTTQQVVNGLRARYAPVRTLWAQHDFSVSVLDRRGKVHTYDGDGTLQLRKPPIDAPAGTPVELRVKGSKDIYGKVFDLGANRDRAWLLMRGDVDAMGWLPQGSDAPFDPKVVPVRPDLVAEVLGVSDWAADVGRYPAPIVVYDPTRDAYRITLVEPVKGGRGLAAHRDVYADRTTLVISRVVFFGPNGRPVVEADLSRWAVMPGTAAGVAPAEIVLTLPLSHATMRLSLRNVKATSGAYPNDGSFTFPSEPDVSRVYRLDQPQNPPE